MKLRFSFFIILGVLTTCAFAQLSFLNNDITYANENQVYELLVASNDSNEQTSKPETLATKTETDSQKPKRENASLTAFIIVVLIFVGLFACPPIFIKLRAKKK